MAIDCLEKAKSTSCLPQVPPRNAAVLAPFVKLKMQASGVEITVGNKSSPQNGNHAVIKSFEFGYTERPICRVVIHDEQGSILVKFMEDLLKNLKCSTEVAFNKATVEFGWIKTTCSNSVAIESSGPYYMMLNTVTCNFDGGKLMYELELTDLMDRHAEARDAVIYGEDGEKGMYMTDAITKLLTDPDFPPSVAEVAFLKLSKDGKSTEPIRFKYKDGDPLKGRKSKWKSNNKDKLNIVMEWLSENVSEDQKSFILTYDATTPGGKIIVWEDPKPKCSETVVLDSCIGQYVVNGGKDSRVINFNPRFKFTFVNLASSGGSDGTNSANSNPANQGKNPGIDCPTLNRNAIKTGGAQNTTSASETNSNVYNKSKPDEVSAETRNEQLIAYFDAATTEPIEADLVILGDPSLPRPLLTKFRPISIVFINPYHLFPQPDAGFCGDWLAAPFCNEVLTNKAWRVKGVTHQIEAGKYTTTIGMFLPAPGVHLDVGQPFGGSGSGGWTPPTQC